MDEGRLAAVKKSQDYNRKFVYVMNDIIKSRQALYETCLSREQQEAESKLAADTVSLKRAVVRNKVLLQCMESRKRAERTVCPALPLGAYGGRPLESLSRDIDRTLAWNHPRLRRLRKVERMKENCLKFQAILDETTVRKKMDSFFIQNITRADSSRHTVRRRRRKQKDALDSLGTRIPKDELYYLEHQQSPDPVSAANVSLRFDEDIGKRRHSRRLNLKNESQLSQSRQTPTLVISRASRSDNSHNLSPSHRKGSDGPAQHSSSPVGAPPGKYSLLPPIPANPDATDRGGRREKRRGSRMSADAGTGSADIAQLPVHDSVDKNGIDSATGGRKGSLGEGSRSLRHIDPPRGERPRQSTIPAVNALTSDLTSKDHDLDTSQQSFGAQESVRLSGTREVADSSGLVGGDALLDQRSTRSSTGQRVETPPTLSRAPTLILPPIPVTKTMVKNKH